MNKMLYQNTPLYRGLFAIAMIALSTTACTKERSPEVDLKIEVQSSGRPGTYLVKGNTNLPEASKITVAAIRHLRPENGSFISEENNSYAILARQTVKVDKGNWQTNLNLWQVAPDGKYQEAWQLNQSESGLNMNPSEQVTFVALLEPAIQSSDIEKTLEEQGKKLKGTHVRYTSDGEWYIRANQSLAVNLPAGKTTPPVLKAEDINNGWGDRFVLKKQPLAPSQVTLAPNQTPQINTPLSPSEFLR